MYGDVGQVLDGLGADVHLYSCITGLKVSHIDFILLHHAVLESHWDGLPLHDSRVGTGICDLYFSRRKLRGCNATGSITKQQVSISEYLLPGHGEFCCIGSL